MNEEFRSDVLLAQFEKRAAKRRNERIRNVAWMITVSGVMIGAAVWCVIKYGL